MFKTKLEILKSILGQYYCSGEEYMFYCPRCEHHKKKLSINLDKNVFKCWICDWRGRDIYRVVRRYGIYDQKQTWKSFGNTVDVANFSSKLFESTPTDHRQKINLPDEFRSLANKNMPKTAYYPINYLESRGIGKSDIIRWKIGYCDEGEYAGRVIIPSFDIDGDVNYFIARAYDREWPKYKNPMGVRKDIVFNELFLDFDEDMTIVEGVFDAIVSGPNAVPLLGSTLSENHPLLEKIVENDTPVYIGMDADAKKKELKIINLLLKHDIEVRKIDIEPFSDIGQMKRDIFLDKKQSAVLFNSENYLYEVIKEAL